MKVFISSVISGLEPSRAAVVEAVTTLGSQVIRAEEFGASPETPQQTCLAGVRKADVVVLLLGARYGEPQASSLSATHEEYREARERCPVLVFVEEGVEMEPLQLDFVTEVRGWASGHYTETWKGSDDLRRRVIHALHELELSSSLGPLDEDEVLQRAIALVPSQQYGFGSSAALILGLAGGPRQQVLRPSELESEALHQEVMREGNYGRWAVLDPSEGTTARVGGSMLHIEQKNASVSLSELGDLRISVPATTERNGSGLAALVEEEVVERIMRVLHFAGWLLDAIDEPRRMSDVAPVVSLTSANYLGWTTRAEADAARSGYSVGSASEAHPVHLTPVLRKRAALVQEVDRLAEDLMVLIRRQRTQ